MNPTPAQANSSSPDSGAGPLLVRLASDYDSSELLRQTPGGSGVWGGIRFTFEPVPECDYLVMLNNRKLDAITVRCPPENVWALMQEPYVPALHEWLIERHEPFARVYTHLAATRSGKYVPSHPAVPWWVGLTYDELVACPIPAKGNAVSWLTSDLTMLPGHRLRNALRQHIARTDPEAVTVYGRGIRPLVRKWEGLAPYRYSIVTENASGPHLWTEKIADCFLAWTVPLYYGCTNLEEYFPADSFIRIDPRDPDSVLARVRQLLAGDEWERRLPALQIARDLVLRKYALFPFLAHAIHQHHSGRAPKQDVTIPGYRWRRFHDLARYLTRRYLTRRIPASEEAELSTMIGDGWRRARRWLGIR